MSHSNSTSGDLFEVFEQVKENRRDQVREARESAEVAYNQRLIHDAYATLPALQQTEGNINFFGSSYSGADIKVVAHMYDEINWSDQKSADLRRKKTISDNVAEGCINLIGGGLSQLVGSTPSDYTTARDAFLAAAFGSTNNQPEDEADAKQQAIKILLNGVFKAGNGFGFLAIAKMQRAAIPLRMQHEALSKEYEQRLEHLQQMGGKNSSSTITLATLQTISVQSFREKNAVRACGHVYPKGYTRGTRTIGGSMIFTIFNEHALSQLIRRLGQGSPFSGGERDTELTTLLPDQLPPIDLTIVFANEYGALSDFRLYGVEWFTDGNVFSIEDLLSESTMNFVCRDADIMTSRGRIKLSRLQRGMFNDKDDKDLSGSSLLFDNDSYNEYLDRIGMRRRLTNR